MDVKRLGYEWERLAEELNADLQVKSSTRISLLRDRPAPKQHLGATMGPGSETVHRCLFLCMVRSRWDRFAGTVHSRIFETLHITFQVVFDLVI